MKQKYGWLAGEAFFVEKLTKLTPKIKGYTDPPLTHLTPPHSDSSSFTFIFFFHLRVFDLGEFISWRYFGHKFRTVCGVGL
jgi:hypothetical protein